MPLTDFSVNKVKLWAVVNGQEIELTRVELNYYLNTVSRATLQCAIGREVKFGSLEPAAIHGIYDQLKVHTPIIIWCEALEAANSGVSGGAWPSGPFVVFDGEIVGVGYRKARSGGAALTLSCKHFLVGLEFSWSPSKKTHPLNIGNFHGKAGIDMQAGNPHFLISTLAKTHFTKNNVTEDYWALALKPWLEDICDQRQIFDNEALDQGNDAAIATLNRFEPFADASEDNPEGGYRFGVPLSMDNFDILGTRPGIDSIVTDASNEGLRSFIGHTIWEKIVADFGSRYLFAVVPMASRAIVAPVIPGLLTLWTTIDPIEYDNIALSSFLPRPLRGVVMETGPNSMTGAFGMLRGRGQDIRTIGGRFENDNMEEGMIFFREAPQWIANGVSQMAWAVHAAAPGKVNGNAFVGPIGQNAPFPDPKQLRDMSKILWDEYAKAVYLYEVFKARTGVVTGRVRFDIAPGSSVQVITTEEKFVKQSGINLGEQNLYGIVTGVTVMIDSEATQGYTSLEISYLRDEIENLDENLTTDVHPLWSEPFAGAPLVEELLAEDPPEIDDFDGVE